jgi:hypothetical protein
MSLYILKSGAALGHSHMMQDFFFSNVSTITNGNWGRNVLKPDLVNQLVLINSYLPVF